MRATRVLVLEDDLAIRRLVRTGLELEGWEVVEAESLAQARAALDHEDELDAVVVDRQLPDGDGLDIVPLVLDRLPSATVLLHTSRETPSDMLSVPKGDIDAILGLLGAGGDDVRQRTDRVRSALRAPGHLRDAWVELCRRDPAIPPGMEPPNPDAVVATVVDAFVRPQPVTELDGALQPVMEDFAEVVESAQVALAMLGRLRQAWTDVGVEATTAREWAGISYRMNLIIDRMMVAAARATTDRLVSQALTDPLTGLGNRRAFEATLEREAARAARHGNALTVAVLDLDGLKAINDNQGHAAGDRALLGLAEALRSVTRTEDSAYRLGGDEFALVMVDAVMLDEDSLEKRLHDAGGPALSLGVASHPPDPLHSLPDVADSRLYQRRYSRR